MLSGLGWVNFKLVVGHSRNFAFSLPTRTPSRNPAWCLTDGSTTQVLNIKAGTANDGTSAPDQFNVTGETVFPVRPIVCSALWPNAFFTLRRPLVPHSNGRKALASDPLPHLEVQFLRAQPMGNA